MGKIAASFAMGLLFLSLVLPGRAQSLGNAGTIAGTVVDTSGAAVPKAVITLRNPLTNYTQGATSAEDGSFRLMPNGAPLAGGVFRIDHDQAFQSTAVLRYQHKNREWIAWTWRYDSGLVVSGIPDAGFAMSALTPNQQISIGLACNGVLATVANPLTDCVGPNGTQGKVTSTLLTLPQGAYDNFPSQENDDHNPDRVKPRNLLDLGLGTDNLFHTEKREKITASLAITNLTNKVALYNFLSTFSGTHFLQPRTFVAKLRLNF